MVITADPISYVRLWLAAQLLISVFGRIAKMVVEVELPVGKCSLNLILALGRVSLDNT